MAITVDFLNHIQNDFQKSMHLKSQIIFLTFSDMNPVFNHHPWLVVDLPSDKYDFVSWDDYSQLNGKIIQMFQPQPDMFNEFGQTKNVSVGFFKHILNQHCKKRSKSQYFSIIQLRENFTPSSESLPGGPGLIPPGNSQDFGSPEY